MNIGDVRDKKLRARAYIRVSTSDQSTSGFSKDAQKREIQEYIKRRSDEYEELLEEHIYTDVASGRDKERKELKKLLEAVKNDEVDTIIVIKLDRLSRSLRDLLDITRILQSVKRKNGDGVSILSIRENIDFRGSIGNLMFQIFGALAEFERTLIGDRTMDGKIESAQQNNYTGSSVPFGYKKVANANGRGSKLEVLEEHAEIVRQVYNWYMYDNKGHEQISKMLIPLLKEKGIQKKFTVEVIGNMLKNTIYMGEYIASRRDNNIIKSYHPVIIDRAEWDIAQSLNDKNKQRYQSENNYMLSGLLKYKDTDGRITPMVGAADKRRGYDTYRANKQHIQKKFTISQKSINEFVWGYIKGVIDNPEAFFNVFLEEQKNKKEDYTSYQSRKNMYKKQLEAIENNRYKAVEKYSEGDLAKKDYEMLLDKYDTDIEKHKEYIKECDNNLELEHYIQQDKEALKALVKGFKSIDEILNTTNNTLKKVICRIFIDTIIVDSDNNIAVHMKFSQYQRKIIEDRWVHTHKTLIDTDQIALQKSDNMVIGKERGKEYKRKRERDICYTYRIILEKQGNHYRLLEAPKRSYGVL